MLDIIRQIREAFPFAMSEQELCTGRCSYGCPKKLLEYIHAEITDWEQRLDRGEIPDFRDLQKLAKTGRKIYRALEKNNLVGGNLRQGVARGSLGDKSL